MRALGFGVGLAFAGVTAAGAAVPAGPAAFDFSGGVLPAGASLARASAASYVGPDGRLALAPADTPRFAHDPASHAALGLLVEPVATNVLRASDDLLAPAWSANDVTLLPGTGIGPDGAAGLARLTQGASGIGYLQQNVASAAGAHVGSVFARAGTRRWLRLSIYDVAHHQAWFDLAGGATGMCEPGVSAAIEPFGGGLFRLSIGYAAVTGAPYLSMFAGDADGGGPSPGTVFVGVTDLVAASAATSHIATIDVPASRAADVLTLAWGALGVPDGAVAVRYTFDDGAHQDVATTIAGGGATAPAFARPLRAAMIV